MLGALCWIRRACLIKCVPWPSPIHSPDWPTIGDSLALSKRNSIAPAETHHPFSIVLLDMDGLKTINDRFGHLTGSRALVRLGKILRNHSRAIDTAAQYGGDEFALILPEAGRDIATRVFSLPHSRTPFLGRTKRQRFPPVPASLARTRKMATPLKNYWVRQGLPRFVSHEESRQQ